MAHRKKVSKVEHVGKKKRSKKGGKKRHSKKHMLKK